MTFYTLNYIQNNQNTDRTIFYISDVSRRIGNDYFYRPLSARSV